MEDRLLKLLDTEQLSSSKFADVIGVQRSSVSHILTGRNKPSFDFLQKTLKAFPMLNADWLILGEGEMYEGEQITGGGSLFDQPAAPGEGSIRAGSNPGESQSDQSGSVTASESLISDPSNDVAGNSESETVQQRGLEPLSGQHEPGGGTPERQQFSSGQQSGQQSGQPSDQQSGQPSDQQSGQQKDLKSHQQSAKSSWPEQQDNAVTSQKSDQAVTYGSGEAGVASDPSSGAVTRPVKKVRRVILFYDDNSFDAYEQA